jgi:hypothetical protein
VNPLAAPKLLLLLLLTGVKYKVGIAGCTCAPFSEAALDAAAAASAAAASAAASGGVEANHGSTMT